jgi:deazaflavin-dependent oxidoreductase (nitroreductase family)
MPQTRYIRWVPSPNNIKRIGKIHTVLYRWSFGLLGARIDGLDVLLLTTVGKKSGQSRCVPLPYFRDGDKYLLVGSYGGNARSPAWVANIAANPTVQVQRGPKRWTARARVATGAERDRLWADITREFPRYAVYQTKTARQIPVVVLES